LYINVELDPTIGDEIKKKRLVVILNAGHQKHLRLAIVVLITGWNPQLEKNPFFVCLEPGATNGLKKISVVDCFQMQAISHKRFTEKIGDIGEDDMTFIKRAIALILDIDPEDCFGDYP